LEHVTILGLYNEEEWLPGERKDVTWMEAGKGKRIP
jgi:hypothetical protein